MSSLSNINIKNKQSKKQNILKMEDLNISFEINSATKESSLNKTQQWIHTDSPLFGTVYQLKKIKIENQLLKQEKEKLKQRQNQYSIQKNKELSQFKAQIKLMNKKLTEEKQKTKNLTESIKQLQRKLTMQEKSKKKIDENIIKDLERQIQKYSNEILNLKAQILKKEEQIKIIKKNEKQINKQVTQIKEKISQTQCKLSIKTKQCQKIQQILQQRKKYYDEEISNLNAHWKEMQNTIANQINQIQQTKEALLDYQFNYTQLEKCNKSIHQQKKMIQKQVKKNESLLEEIRKQLTFLTPSNKDILLMINSIKSTFMKWQIQKQEIKINNQRQIQSLNHKIKFISESNFYQNPLPTQNLSPPQNQIRRRQHRKLSMTNLNKITPLVENPNTIPRQRSVNHIRQQINTLRQIRHLRQIKDQRQLTKQKGTKLTIQELILKKCKEIVF